MKRIKPKMLVKERKVGQKNKTSKQTSLQSTDEFHLKKKAKHGENVQRRSGS